MHVGPNASRSGSTLEDGLMWAEKRDVRCEEIEITSLGSLAMKGKE